MLNQGDGTFAAMRCTPAGRMPGLPSRRDARRRGRRLIRSRRQARCLRRLHALTSAADRRRRGGAGQPAADQHRTSRRTSGAADARHAHADAAPRTAIRRRCSSSSTRCGSFGRELLHQLRPRSRAARCATDTPVQGAAGRAGDLDGGVAERAARRDPAACGNTAGHLRLRAGVPRDVVRERRAARRRAWSRRARRPRHATQRPRRRRGPAVNSVRRPQDETRSTTAGSTRGSRQGLESVAEASSPSTPGVDAVAVADVDGDACNDVVAAGDYGTGMVHLGDGASALTAAATLPQLGYSYPVTTTRVSMAVGDLTRRLSAAGHACISDKWQRRDGLPQPPLRWWRRSSCRAAAARAPPR